MKRDMLQNMHISAMWLVIGFKRRFAVACACTFSCVCTLYDLNAATFATSCRRSMSNMCQHHLDSSARAPCHKSLKLKIIIEIILNQKHECSSFSVLD